MSLQDLKKSVKFDIINVYLIFESEMRNVKKNKEMIKRRRVALLALVLALVTLLSACRETGLGEGTPAESESLAETPSQTPEGSSPEEIPDESKEEIRIDPSWEVKEALDLIADRICEYTLVRPEIMGDELQYEVMELKKAMGQLTRDPVKIAEDWLNPYTNQQPEELEIIIGDCDRDETRYVLDGLKYNDWAVEIVGRKLVIAGNTEETTVKAIAYFKQFVDALSAGDDFIFLPEDCKTARAAYRLDDITISGSVKEYKIVIPTLCSAVEKNAANALAEHIASLTGYTIKVVKDSTEETAHEILIGKTSRQASADVNNSVIFPKTLPKCARHLWSSLPQRR